VSFSQDPERTARVRAAFLATMSELGPRSLSQFIDEAVMVEVEKPEAKSKGGKPFTECSGQAAPRPPVGGMTLTRRAVVVQAQRPGTSPGLCLFS